MIELQGVLAAAAEVEEFCRARAWQFCFIGGIAVQRWGTPRFTQDVDLTLLVPFGSEAPFIDDLLAAYRGRLSDARRFAIQRRVLLARTSGGVDLDFALGAFPFEEDSVTRATPWQVAPAICLTTCSAEDLIIHKVFAGRDRDWGDVESVLSRQHDRLDLARVRRDLPPLLEIKETPEYMERLESLVKKIHDRLST